MTVPAPKFISQHPQAFLVITISLMLFICAVICTEIIVRQSEAAGLELKDGVYAGRQTVLSTVIGRLESLVGDMMIMKADAYFHGMSSYMEYAGSKSKQGRVCTQIEGPHDHCDHEHHKHDEHCGHQHAEKEHIETGFDNFFFQKYQAVSSSEHVHLEDDKELLPWLSASIRLNPHNVRAFIISAYWVGNRLKKQDQAERIIREGLRYNNTNWQLRYELGKIHASREEYKKATVQYLNAIRFFPNKPFEESELEQANIWRSIAGVYEERGLYDEAVEAYSNVLRLHPLEQSYRRLEELKLKSNSNSAPVSRVN